MMASPSFHSGTLMSLIHRVEQTDAGTGALICQASGDQLATVLLEEGRICWAVASGMRRRLTDLLLEGNDRLDRKSLESIYRDCRGRNVPLGEELVRAVGEVEAVRPELAGRMEMVVLAVVLAVMVVVVKKRHLPVKE